MSEHKRQRRESPASNRIPLPFEQAVEGLLGIDPTALPPPKPQPVKKSPKAAKKPEKKKDKQ